MVRIILASSSPRRIELLKRLGLKFEVHPPIYETHLLEGEPWERAVTAAFEKARQVAGFYTEGYVIGADTIVVIDGQILGKPRNLEEARMFLKMLSGRVHKVITGIVIINAENHEYISDYEVTKVKFKALTDDEIEFYLKTGEPMDKAGAYAIQGLGSLFIERIEGDYYNVVGLPLNKLYRMFQKFGINFIELLSSI